jgi:hypothetical protein
MHALTQWGGKTPVINILAIPFEDLMKQVEVNDAGAMCVLALY